MIDPFTFKRCEKRINMKMCFLKFSERSDHLSDLIEKGHVYINNIDYFRRYEKNGHKYDRHELATHYHQHVGASVTLAGRKFNIAEPFSVRHGGVSFTHIYCLYTLSDESIKKVEDNQVFNRRLWNDFGDHLVFIHNANEFLNRLFAKLESMKFGYKGTSKNRPKTPKTIS